VSSYRSPNSSDDTRYLVDAPHRDALKAAIEALADLGLRYFMFGANAQNVWGNPRFTRDVDLVVFMGDERFDEFIDTLAGRGFAVDEAAGLALLRSGRMARVHFGSVLVDFVLGETDFDDNALVRRRTMHYLGLQVYVVSAEDLILYKLISRRPQDLADVEHVARRQRTELDWTYLRSWATWLADETGLPHIVETLNALAGRFAPNP